MKRLWLILPLVLCLAAPAAAQRFRLKVSQRPDGGQTVGFGGASQPQQPQPQPRPPAAALSAAARGQIETLAQTVIDEIASTQHLTPETAASVVRQLTAPDIARLGATPRSRSLYNRTLSYAAAVTGDIPLARGAASEWRQAAPTDPAAIRNLLMMGILAGDRSAAEGAIKALSAERHARWLPWTTYMRSFLPLIGVRPKVTLATAEGRPLVVGGSADRVTILVFTATRDEAPLLTHLSEPYQGRPVDIVAVSLGPGGEPAGGEAAKSLGITAVPTALVFAHDGNVVFAGDPRTWEVHAAVGSALAQASAQTPAPPTEPTEPVVTRAQERKAQDLRSRGWDLLRLGVKTHSSVHKQQGRDLLNQCIREYPGSAAARQAKWDLRNFEP